MIYKSIRILILFRDDVSIFVNVISTNHFLAHFIFLILTTSFVDFTQLMRGEGG